MSRTWTIARKELWSYFASPTAVIFLGAYLLVSLFAFFWVEKFFSRNIADLRPLFEWMPILLIFLCATLTMRMWSEERKMGTVEFLLTLPVKTHELVLGKFVACMGMVVLALALTFGLALTVGMLGPLDWGPALTAYVASILLAASYIAIGLYISSKTDNQIVSLITTSIVGFFFYIVGSDMLVNFFGNKMGEVLRLFGSGSRFTSISRGILDLRDIYYYVSISAVFLITNVFALEKLKWSSDKRPAHTVWITAVSLLIANLLVGNFWLNRVPALRLDVTHDRIYSISDSTKDILSHLQEPLLLRGYFSERTHPLLAPLVPTVRDLLSEYKIVGKGKVQVEFIDPRDNAEIEAEAHRKYNIEPVPFQVNDRHSASMINSYFNIVVQYGDQHEVLGFENLIEVKHDNVGNIEVELRNLEYDISRSIQKVLHEFNKTDNFFASLDHDIQFVGYVSEKNLPKQLQALFADVKTAVNGYEKDSGGKLKVEFLDPSADPKLAEKISQEYGFSAQSLGLFSDASFYFYLTIQDKDKIYSLGVPEDLNVSGFKKSMDSTLKRMVPGFLRTAGLVLPAAPAANPMMAQFGQAPQGGKSFRSLEQKLAENYTTEKVDLESGTVPSNVDILAVLAPKDLNEKQIFAIDQFLMQGGTVILATSPVGVERQERSFSAQEYNSGLDKWLGSYGIEIPKELVLDKRNSGFPAMRKRTVQGYTVKEPYLAPYPFFIDVRDKGLSSDNLITSGLSQINLAWASPLVINADTNKERKVTTLITSSKESWRSKNIDIEADRTLYPELGFPEADKKEASVLGAVIEGTFTSYFKGKDSPLLAKGAADKPKDEHGHDHGDHDHGKEGEKKDEPKVAGVIDKSPSSARIMIFSSNEFLADDAVQISSMLRGSQYTNSMQLLENALDWSTQDRSLLGIRSRSHFARTLEPLTDTQKRNWEFANYGFAIFALLLVYAGYRMRRSRMEQDFEKLKLA